MVDLKIICPKCGKKGPEIIGAASRERVIQLIQSWVCECGVVISENEFDIPDGFKQTEKKIDEETIIVMEPKYKTIIPVELISKFIKETDASVKVSISKKIYSKTYFKDMTKAQQIELIEKYCKETNDVHLIPKNEDGRVELLVKLYGDKKL